MIDFANLLLFICSLVILFFVFKSIKKYGIRTYSIFLFMFYLCLLFNTIKLSIYQEEKSIFDLYYLLVGPLLFALPLYLSEKVKKLRIYYLPFFNLKYIFICLFVLYIFLKIYISSIVGWRIESLFETTYLVDGDSLSVPGYSGLALSLQWTLLMMSPYMSKKIAFIFVVVLVIFALLHVKRGDILRALLFYLIYFMHSSLKRDSFKKTLRKMVLYVCCILFVFVILGNLRQSARGGSDSEIVKLSGLKINNEPLAWVYSYFAINYDILRKYYDVTPAYYPNALKETFLGEEQSKLNYNINGFNASTFLRQFIVDYGPLFFFEILIYGLLLGFIVIIAKSLYIETLNVFICSMLFLSPFGNYFQSRAIFVSIIFIIIINFFVIRNLNEER